MCGVSDSLAMVYIGHQILCLPSVWMCLRMNILALGVAVNGKSGARHDVHYADYTVHFKVWLSLLLALTWCAYLVCTVLPCCTLQSQQVVVTPLCTAVRAVH